MYQDTISQLRRELDRKEEVIASFSHEIQKVLPVVRSFMSLSYHPKGQ